jgi:ABC-2 type transport system ATP-binding protein
LALGCRAEVLLLDEPLASLDPLARREALSVLVEGSREAGSTVLLSSHTIGDIEDACDHLIVLGVGRTLLDQPVPEALARHRVADDASAPLTTAASRGSVVATFPGSAGRRHLLLRVDDAGGELAGTRAPTLHEIVLGYLTAGRGAGLASERDA